MCIEKTGERERKGIDRLALSDEGEAGGTGRCLGYKRRDGKGKTAKFKSHLFPSIKTQKKGRGDLGAQGEERKQRRGAILGKPQRSQGEVS